MLTMSCRVCRSIHVREHFCERSRMFRCGQLFHFSANGSFILAEVIAMIFSASRSVPYMAYIGM